MKRLHDLRKPKTPPAGEQEGEGMRHPFEIEEGISAGDCGKYQCEKCGYESGMVTDFIFESPDLLCLECAGYAPPTCGKHGDY